MAEINADGTATIFIGNYFEGAYPEPPPQPLKFYMPFVSNAEEGTDLFEPITARMGTLYFYADGQRIAMKKDGVVSCIYGDQLGSVSAVADGNGNLISETLYHPWGTTRYAQGTSPTDYGYTGQMKEGDIYFYNARWYDPQLGRFMQADTFMPPTQGTQAWDRFAYVNNNPIIYSDPLGYKLCNDHYESNCYVPIPQNNIPTINSWREIADNPLLLLTYVILSEENGKLFTKSESDAYGVAYVVRNRYRDWDLLQYTSEAQFKYKGAFKKDRWLIACTDGIFGMTIKDGVSHWNSLEIARKSMNYTDNQIVQRYWRAREIASDVMTSSFDFDPTNGAYFYADAHIVNNSVVPYSRTHFWIWSWGAGYWCMPDAQFCD